MIEVIHKTGQELKVKFDWNTWVTDEDIAFGTQLFAAVHYCPSHLVEAAKLYHFFDNLISSQSLNTVLAATFNTVQPRAGDSIKDFTAVNMWYQRLEERYNFSLGPNILPMLSSNELDQLTSFDPPYLKEYGSAINRDNVSLLFGKKAELWIQLEL